jgi:hypothetical protein
MTAEFSAQFSEHISWDDFLALSIIQAELVKESITGPILYKWLHTLKALCNVVYEIQHEKDRIAKEEVDRLAAEQEAAEEAARVAAEEAEEEGTDDDDA